MHAHSLLLLSPHLPGGGSGIGRAVCQALAKEGAAVAAADISRQNVEETLTLLDTGET